MQLGTLHTTAYMDCLKLLTQSDSSKADKWKGLETQMDFSKQATFQPTQTQRKLLCDSILWFQSAFPRFQC